MNVVIFESGDAIDGHVTERAQVSAPQGLRYRVRRSATERHEVRYPGSVPVRTWTTMNQLQNRERSIASERPILTVHAADRMRERNVSFANLRSALRNPFLICPSPASRCERFIASVMHGPRRAWLVVVVCRLTGQVVTVYWQSRRRITQNRSQQSFLSLA